MNECKPLGRGTWRRSSNRGRAVQVEPMKPVLKAPGSTLLRLRCDGPLSNFAFKFNSRRYTQGRRAECGDAPTHVHGRGLRSSTSQLNLSRFGQ